MRGKVVRFLKKWDAISVENRVHPGTPDVNHVHGWVELKWRRSWPTKPETVVEIDHFTTEQKVWLKRRWRRGGTVYLLLQVRREWLLFTAPMAAQFVGCSTRAELIENALEYTDQGMTEERLKQWLSPRHPKHLPQ
jgi:hypothetical protein